MSGRKTSWSAGVIVPGLLVLSQALTACGGGASASPTQASSTPVPPPPPTPTATTVPTPTNTPLPTVDLGITVWEQEPQVPVLTYHAFHTNPQMADDAYDMHYDVLRAQLQNLYDAGYSLISLDEWLKGNLSTPPGRRPLLVTMDDLFFNNQITLVNGEPDPTTGIGVFWQFYQEHPDFDFHLALFASLGDKLYANPDDPSWEEQLAQAIAWCLDHGVGVYNHLYTHPRLDMTKMEWILWEPEMNDKYLRELLNKINRADLIPGIANIIALPYGLWPETYEGRQLFLSYKNPEGEPLQAVMEIGPLSLELFMKPPYAEGFDAYRLPRFIADDFAIVYLVVNNALFPAAGECVLTGIPEVNAEDLPYLSEQVRTAVSEGRCAPGKYVMGEAILEATAAEIRLVFP